MLRITRVRAPNPGVYTLDGTNTWVVGEHPAAIIDPGPVDQGHLERIAREAADDIAVILLTHAHEDHAPAASVLAEMTGAPVLANSPRMGERAVVDGQEIQVGGATLVAMHTPGHSPDSMVFLARQVSALFTGDSVLGTGTSLIDPPEGDLVLYLRSLRRMQELRVRSIYPGHGPVVFNAQGKLDEYIAHRIEREQQVLAALEDGMSTIDDMVFDIYEEYPDEVKPLAARSVLAHLLKLENEGRVERFRDEDLEHWIVAGQHHERPEQSHAPVPEFIAATDVDDASGPDVAPFASGRVDDDDEGSAVGVEAEAVGGRPIVAESGSAAGTEPAPGLVSEAADPELEAGGSGEPVAPVAVSRRGTVPMGGPEGMEELRRLLGGEPVGAGGRSEADAEPDLEGVDPGPEDDYVWLWEESDGPSKDG